MIRYDLINLGESTSRYERVTLQIAGKEYQVYEWNTWGTPVGSPAIPTITPGTVCTLSVGFGNLGGNSVSVQTTGAHLFESWKKLSDKRQLLELWPKLDMRLLPKPKAGTTIMSVPKTGGMGNSSRTFAFGEWNSPLLALDPAGDTMIAPSTASPVASNIIIKNNDPEYGLLLTQALVPSLIVPGAQDLSVTLASASAAMNAFQASLANAEKPITESGANALLTTPAVVSSVNDVLRKLSNAPGPLRTFALLNAAAAAIKLGKGQFDAVSRLDLSHSSKHYYNRRFDASMGMLRGAFASLLKLHPAMRAVFATMSVSQAIEVYDNFAKSAGLPTIVEILSVLCRKISTSKFDACRCDSFGYFDNRSSLKQGQIYSSPYFNIVVRPMPHGIFGETIVSTMPFQISLNSSVQPGRAFISGTHEMLHGMEELCKLNMSHEQLHALAIHIAQDMFPAMKAMEQSLLNAEKVG